MNDPVTVDPLSVAVIPKPVSPPFEPIVKAIVSCGSDLVIVKEVKPE